MALNLKLLLSLFYIVLIQSIAGHKIIIGNNYIFNFNKVSPKYAVHTSQEVPDLDRYINDQVNHFTSLLHSAELWLDHTIETLNRKISTIFQTQEVTLGPTEQPQDILTVCMVEPNQDVPVIPTKPPLDLTVGLTYPNQDVPVGPTKPPVDLTVGPTYPNQDVPVSPTKPPVDLTVGLTYPNQDVPVSPIKPPVDLTVGLTFPNQDVPLSPAKPPQDITIDLTQPNQDINLGVPKPNGDITLSTNKPNEDVTLGLTTPKNNITLDVTEENEDDDAINSIENNQNITFNPTKPIQNMVVAPPRQGDKKNNTFCDAYIEPPRINYSIPGRRISEVKCFEYAWEARNKSDKLYWDIECLGETEISIIGGNSTFNGEFPHMGAVGWLAVNGSYVIKCGSSLISPRFVLTAAHCSRASERDVSLADPVPKIVRFGYRNVTNDETDEGDESVEVVFDVKISKIYTHPDYSSPKKYNDIAIFELERDVEFTQFTRPACLWNDAKNESYGNRVTVTGWGVIDVVTGETAKELQVAEIDIIETEACNEYLDSSCNRLWCGVENQICAGKLGGGVDTCQGDSGGPLQVEIHDENILPLPTDVIMHTIIGITQFGIGCALASTPGVYAKVSSYIDWIESIVWENK